ncbi:MAG TPA: UDP-N-acetylmuramoyl-tripeptide--D-alanyl-D-alanine ligase [Tepidisphaeraceae bacterium]|nr:UDP-N-acetylmuramoyl-tripeptide--D-alanyl-D-alanine ligase [Tepidisphaeraceae bacterium]
MIPLTIRQIRQAVRGRFLAPQPAESPQSIVTVCTDSRRIEPGCLFIALRGENFDAHQFLNDAAAGGAIAALVEEPPTAPLPNLHLIQVPSTRTAMGMLARYARKHMRAKVIGVAGSNGKTSTKYLIHTALGAKLRGSASPKSFNNDIGVPLAIFPADPNQDYLVLEMGTNHHGEIKVLTEMALPDIAVITNCGAEHLEFLDDLMGVRRENATIIAGLNPKGLLIINGDDRDLVDAVAHYPGKKVMFGFGEQNDLFASDVVCTERGVTFKLNGTRDVFVPMLGRHTAANALAAIAVARRLRVSEEAIIESLATAEGPDMRLQLDDVNGIKLLNDAYNANPNSMRAALETVAGLPTTGRRIAVLGEMRELGKSSERYHREIGEFAATCKLDMLVCVGPNAALIADAAGKSGMNPKVISTFADAPTAAPAVRKSVKKGDLVLLKASRGIRLEFIAQALAETPQSTPARVRKVAG